MKKIKTLVDNVFAYLDKKEHEKTQTETVNLLMKLTFSSNVIDAVEVKKQFDLEFNSLLAKKRIEREEELKVINSYK